MSASMKLKQLIRPLVPDRLMARYRLAQHSRQVRTNVDVAITDPGERKRWLGTTPDTYRVVDASLPIESATTEAEIVTLGSVPERAVELLNLPGAEVGVVARVATPAIVGRKRTEPQLDPIAIAARSTVVAEVGGVPEGEGALRCILDRVRDAGRRIALLPIAADGPIDVSRTDTISKPPVVILSAVPMHDVGGGSRANQLALEFVRRGYHVTFVALFGTQESADLGLRFIHPHLEQLRADAFAPGDLLSRVSNPGLVVVEVPSSAYQSPVDALRERGWVIVYDHIDDWSDPALGGEWYDAATEAWYMRTSDHVVASAADLAVRSERMGVTATVVPNGVNAEVFGDVAEREVPRDFPSGDGPVLGYVGSLYGAWFDWAALERVAVSFPDARVIVIGDDKDGHPAMPSNVLFLGLKAQFELPAYVRRFDVGLLPFTVSATTHAVSPLKIYEYLASGVPVAAPPLRTLDGLPGVATSDDLAEAVRCALSGATPDAASMIEQHAWSERVASIVDLAEFASLVGDTPVEVVRRPVTHYEKSARVVDMNADRPTRSD